MLRAGRDEDAEGFIALIGACWAEFPNCVLDVDGEVPELRALASYFTASGGALWAAEQEGRVIGMAAARPMQQDQAWEVCKVYVDAQARGTGLAHRLLDAAEEHARTAGAERLVLWTDTRFEAAHRFYEKRGFLRQGSIRILDDISKSLEFRYAKPLKGMVVEALDAAAAASAERRLSEILIACVAGGASLSYLPPLAPAVAQSFWKRVSSEVALGRSVLLAAWVDGVLAGCVLLDLDSAQDQPQRADLAKLLVDPAARRQGVARALMQRAEQTARGIGRPCLALETRSGDAMEALVRSLGWQQAGVIPGFLRNADRTPGDIAIFWKRVD
jgi:GNAT superfamily N-acetyltransferase